MADTGSLRVAPEELRGFFFPVAVLQTDLAALLNTNINSVTKSNCLCAPEAQRSKISADVDVRDLHASCLHVDPLLTWTALHGGE